MGKFVQFPYFLNYLLQDQQMMLDSSQAPGLVFSGLKALSLHMYLHKLNGQAYSAQYHSQAGQ